MSRSTTNLTVAGTTTMPATNVTVSGTGVPLPGTANLYADATWALPGVTPADGANTFAAIAQDALNRRDTNSVTVNLPANASYTYDGNGNLTSDSTRCFAYDDENQLTSVWVTNTWRSDFVYDGKFRRRLRFESTWSGSAWVTNIEVHYVYDGNLVIQERYFDPRLATVTPQQTISYTRGTDLSGSREGAGGIGGLLARTDSRLMAIGSAYAHAFYHADAMGNIRAMVNTAGTLVAKYLYDPFGRILGQIGSLAEDNVYRFSSKEFHALSGLVYYLYRFYDPGLQRWLNKDPLQGAGLPGFDWPGLSAVELRVHPRIPSDEPDDEGANLYAALANNPLGGTDAFGLKTKSKFKFFICTPWITVKCTPNGPVKCRACFGISIPKPTPPDYPPGRFGEKAALTSSEDGAPTAVGTKPSKPTNHWHLGPWVECSFP